jgi:hypothetical protein
VREKRTRPIDEPALPHWFADRTSAGVLQVWRGSLSLGGKSMLKRFVMGTAVVATCVMLGASAYAWDCSTDCDTSLRQGRVFEAWDSSVVYGSGGAKLTRTWIPLLIDDGGPLLEDTVVRIVDNRIFGGVSLYSSTGGINGVVCFGMVDYDFTGFDPVGSNDIVIYEASGYGDTVGRLLGDGRLVWRANYAGTAQNGLEWAQCVPNQLTPIPEPEEGEQILAGPGINGQLGTAYIGTPGAIEHGANMYVGNTNFDGFSGDIPRAVNIWDYDPTAGPSPSQTPDYSYTQAGAEAFCNANGVACDADDGRQTQPVFALVEGVYYVVFGANDTDNGGSARPGLFCVDAFEDGDDYTGAIAVLPPAGYRFVDHQANGGGSNVYENNHFEMNSSGQLAALAEKITADPTDPNDAPTWRALLYNPVISAGRIVGYNSPILVADAGPDDLLPDDGLAGPFYWDDPNDPNNIVTWYNSISGVGINDRGNLAFTATYDTGVPFDPNDPNSPTIWNNAAYFWDAGTNTLHQVLREEDIVTYDNGGSPIAVQLGLISREDSDAFMGSSLAKDADVLAVNFRPYTEDLVLGNARGVAVVAVGHNGDVDFDGDVDLSDLAALLSAYGSQFGTSPNYDPQSDYDLDGDVDLADLAELLGSYGS